MTHHSWLRRPQVLGHYNRSLGRPSDAMVGKLRAACAEIAAVDTWPEFFARLGLVLPARGVVTGRLLDAVENSRQKGYHR